MTRISDPSYLDHLVDRQMTLWEVRRRLAEEGETRRHPPEGPWVTISKEAGAGGEQVGREVAERLGWQLFDKEILQGIARNTRTREKILSHLDQHAVGALADYLSHLFVPKGVGQAVFAREMVQVIFTLARNGEAVIVGRGANWLLNPLYGLRVRVVAPLKVRIRRTMEADGLDRETAERTIRQADEEMARFIRHVYRRDVADPTGYDLVVSLEAMDPGTAARIVVDALRTKIEPCP